MRPGSRIANALVVLAALALMAIHLLTASHELVLWVLPVFVLVSLLGANHYLFEDKLVAIVVRRRSPRRPRAASQRWVVARSLLRVSLIERSPLSERGPPALARAV